MLSILSHEGGKREVWIQNKDYLNLANQIALAWFVIQRTLDREKGDWSYFENMFLKLSYKTPSSEKLIMNEQFSTLD